MFVKYYANVKFMKGKIRKGKNCLMSLDWFDENFWGFFSNENNVIRQFNEKRYKVSNDSLSSRVITHWQSTGILSDERPNSKGWRKFSLSEQIWIACIVKLRKFGMDLTKIKKVKEELELYCYNEIESTFPRLDFYIAFAIATEKPVKLIVFNDGEALIGRQYDIDIAKQFGCISDDYITIDINKIVNQFLKNKQINTDYLDYAKSEIEKEVFHSLYIDNIKSLSVKLNNGKEYLVNKERILSTKKEMEALLNKLDFAEGSTIKQGKRKYHKIDEKKKIKK